MSFIIGAIKIIIVLGTLITIHELGHFLVAKACKVRVNKFAIGFGPKILKKQGKETEYTLRLIPFGGFVQLEGEEEASNDERAFNNKPIYQRILIVAAGATVNIVFSLIIIFIISASLNEYYDSKIAGLDENTIEYNAGLRSGDTILKLNGKNILVAFDVDNIIVNSKDDNFIFTIERENKIQNINVNIPITKKGMLGITYDRDCNIVSVTEDTPAFKAGLQSGDKIISLNDVEITDYSMVYEIINKLPDSKVNVKIQRDGEMIEYNVPTMSTEGRYYNFGYDVISPSGFNVIVYALNQTGDYFNATIAGIASLFTGKTENVEVKGPVGVADMIASTEGWLDFFYLMAAISLSLGIFNLFPIPALDGGKILLLIIEKIRRKPFSQNTEAIATLVGFSLIILLAIIVTVSDVVGFFS